MDVTWFGARMKAILMRRRRKKAQICIIWRRNANVSGERSRRLGEITEKLRPRASLMLDKIHKFSQTRTAAGTESGQSLAKKAAAASLN
jgi:hypothetical protein